MGLPPCHSSFPIVGYVKVELSYFSYNGQYAARRGEITTPAGVLHR